MLIMKSMKSESAEGIELENQEYIRTLEQGKNYKYWEILAADIIKPAKMKEK